MRQNCDFDLRALYAALDAERLARGLSWAAATREMNRQAAQRAPRPANHHAMSASTVKGIGNRRVVEGDGVLAMLRWLGRPPEDFIPGRASVPQAMLPQIPAGKVLRFDTKKLFAVVNTQRIQRNLSWAQAAAQAGVGLATFQSLSRGGRTGFPDVMRITGWLRRPAADFFRFSDQ